MVTDRGRAISVRDALIKQGQDREKELEKAQDGVKGLMRHIEEFNAMRAAAQDAQAKHIARQV